MDRGDKMYLGFMCFMSGILFGFLFAMHIRDETWRCWAVEKNYAHYSPDTGEFVLEPNTQE